MTDRPHLLLNPRVRGLGPSATLAINERSDGLRAAGRQVWKLGLGQSPFPVPECVTEALRTHAHEKDYLAVQGLRALRESIAAWHGAPYTAADVLVGPGSKELMFLVQLVFDGELLLPSPSWVSYAPQANIIGRWVHWVDTRAEDGWRLAPAALAEVCAEEPGRPRLLVLNYPSNPTGATYTPEQLQALVEVCRAHRVVVLSDEIYGAVHHTGGHTSIAQLYPEGTIISSGLSKWCGAGGWRLGYFVFPRALRPLLDGMAAVASETFTSTSAPIQHAAVRAFQGGDEIERYLTDSRRILDALGRACTRRLRAAGATLPDPEGGFYLFADFSACADHPTSEAFCEAALEATGVAFLPGTCFGRPPAELTARLAYVDFDGAEALRLAARTDVLDEAFLARACGRTLEAFDRLCAWLS